MIATYIYATVPLVGLGEGSGDGIVRSCDQGMDYMELLKSLSIQHVAVIF